MRKNLVFMLLACLFAGSSFLNAAHAEEAVLPDTQTHPNVWHPQTKSVAIFKNGLGFFVQEGKVQLHEGWCRGASVPPAAFGTFAVYSQNEGSAVDTIALGPGEILEFDGRQKPDTLEARHAALAPCLGLNIELTCRRGETDTTSAGKFINLTDSYAILESNSDRFAVSLSEIRKMQILDLPLRVHVGNSKIEQDSEKSDASSDTSSSETKEVTLGMSYLRSGIAWVPEYSLTILDDETAELTLRGTIINEAEDLIGTDVHLVVGVPHFMHTEFMTPLVVGQAIRTLGTNLAASANLQIPQQMMTQQVMNSAPEISRSASASTAATVPVSAESTNVQQVLGSVPAIDAAGASDYTVYTRKNLTLRRGERAMLTLFSYKIRYSHIYQWNVGGKMTHSLRVHNETPTAWTTGPCIAVSGSQALTEDTLKYTPKNSVGELALTESINIGQEHQQSETERKIAAHVLQGRSFDCVQLTGTVTIRNFEPREAEIIVTVPVEGKALTADHDGTVTQDASELRLTARRSTVSWHLKLPAGETQVLSYTYERYVESL